MESEKKQVDEALLRKIEDFELKERKKKKKKGWRPSKLDCVSHVLFEMRSRGASLQSMANFVLQEFQISANKSTVMYFFDRLKIQTKETNDVAQK